MSIILSEEEWNARIQQHQNVVGPYADAFIKRRSLKQKNPVEDFLFTYYSCSPTKLKQWVPSIHETLLLTANSTESYPWLAEKWFICENDTLLLDKQKLQSNTRSLANFVAELCRNISQRPPRYSCFGLHEWAMVYKQSAEEIRHQGHELRLSPDCMTEFVEKQNLCCTHYDAYRFFTKEAQPLNSFAPSLDTRLQMEQGGCIHANMDLYKWSIKFWPWVGSDFIVKTFLNALKGRILDMRASPYDLRQLGYDPICIETEEGRKVYQKEQRLYAEESSQLRNELGAFCEYLSTYA